VVASRAQRAGTRWQPSTHLLINLNVEAYFVANIKSQIKRIGTNEKARLRNKSVKSSLKTAVRRFRDAAEAGDQATAQIELKSASRELDKAVSKGVIHANQAANKKSAMALRINAIDSK
jgi:small subunit ribosomal protein S20